MLHSCRLACDAAPTGKVDEKAIGAIAKDLQSVPGGSLVVTGDQYGPEIHALVQAINAKLGAFGKTVFHTQPVDATVLGGASDLKSLVDDLKGGKVQALFIFGGNPVYDAPADYKFAEALSKAKFKDRIGHYDDETAQACDWLVPTTHTLEEWGDALAYDGTLSIIQPLIAPLYQGKSVAEIVSTLAGKPQGGYELVRSTWKSLGVTRSTASPKP